jgi:hypothetical protein
LLPEHGVPWYLRNMPDLHSDYIADIRSACEEIKSNRAKGADVEARLTSLEYAIKALADALLVSHGEQPTAFETWPQAGRRA